MFDAAFSRGISGGSVALSARHEVRRSGSRGTLLRHRNAMSQRVSKTSENRRNRIPTQCVAGDEGLRNRGRRRGKECVIDAVSTTSDDPERSLGPEPNTTFKVGLSSEHTPFSTELPCVPSKASERKVYRWNKRPSKGSGLGYEAPSCPTAERNIRLSNDSCQSEKRRRSAYVNEKLIGIV